MCTVYTCNIHAQEHIKGGGSLNCSPRSSGRKLICGHFSVAKVARSNPHPCGHAYPRLFKIFMLNYLYTRTSSWRPFRTSWLRPSHPMGAQAVWPTQIKSKQIRNSKLKVRWSEKLTEALERSSWPYFEKYSKRRAGGLEFCDRGVITFSGSWINILFYKFSIEWELTVSILNMEIYLVWASQFSNFLGPIFCLLCVGAGLQVIRVDEE